MTTESTTLPTATLPTATRPDVTRREVTRPDMEGPGETDAGAAHARLTSLGWLSWAEAATRLADLDAVWLAPGGLVRKGPREPWPTDLPVTTRIHAWSPGSGRLWRLIPRSVDSTVLVTHLDSEPNEPNDSDGILSCPVTTTTTADRQWQRVWVVGATPIMFLRSTVAAAPE